MTQSGQKTALPWKLIGQEVLEDGSIYPPHIIGGERDLQICSFFKDSVSSEANAAFIVLAANNYDALVEALEKVLVDVEETRSHFCGRQTQIRNSTVGNIEALLASIKG